MLILEGDNSETEIHVEHDTLITSEGQCIYILFIKAQRTQFFSSIYGGVKRQNKKIFLRSDELVNRLNE